MNISGMLYCRCDPGQGLTVEVIDEGRNIRLRVPRVLPTVEIIMNTADARELALDLAGILKSIGVKDDDTSKLPVDRLGPGERGLACGPDLHRHELSESGGAGS